MKMSLFSLLLAQGATLTCSACKRPFHLTRIFGTLNIFCQLKHTGYKNTLVTRILVKETCMKKSVYQAIRLFLFSLLLPLLGLIFNSLRLFNPEILYNSPVLFIGIAHVFGLTTLVLTQSSSIKKHSKTQEFVKPFPQRLSHQPLIY